jgi:hypothetical protein
MNDVVDAQTARAHQRFGSRPFGGEGIPVGDAESFRRTTWTNTAISHHRENWPAMVHWMDFIAQANRTIYRRVGPFLRIGSHR